MPSAETALPPVRNTRAPFLLLAAMLLMLFALIGLAHAFRTSSEYSLVKMLRQAPNGGPAARLLEENSWWRPANGTSFLRVLHQNTTKWSVSGALPVDVAIPIVSREQATAAFKAKHLHLVTQEVTFADVTSTDPLVLLKLRAASAACDCSQTDAGITVNTVADAGVFVDARAHGIVREILGSTTYPVQASWSMAIAGVIAGLSLAFVSFNPKDLFRTQWALGNLPIFIALPYLVSSFIPAWWFWAMVTNPPLLH